MKYKVLYQFLKFVIYLKRAIWWTGSIFINFLEKSFFKFWRFFAFFYYKVKYFWHKSEFKKTDNWVLKRNVLQAFAFLILLFIAIPQTKIYAQKETHMPGTKAIAYNFSENQQEFSLQEVVAKDNVYFNSEEETWKQGVVVGDQVIATDVDPALIHEQDLAGLVAGGSAVSQPTIMPGVELPTVETPVYTSDRKNVVRYTVKQGDSLGLIAQKHDISLLTLLWANGLSSKSVIQPGDTLDIPPVSGVLHTVKSGDTVLKIARTYDAKASEIIKFNDLTDGGSSLQIGQKLMVPDGVKRYTSSASTASSNYTTSQSSVSVKTVPSSSQLGSSGWVWPSAAKTITQYYHWQHHGLDIAGPWQSANYAAKAGTVKVSQCGWNSGYGCYIIIDHGGGVETLYGHHSKLLVSVGDKVKAGQTIGLMGNTGKVYGRTGIHLHFEIRINGVRVNPLGYIR